MSKGAPSDTEAKKQEYLDVEPVPSAIDHASKRRLRNKINLTILPTVCVLYLFCFISCANIRNAKLASFKRDISIKGYDYNATLTMFYISYILFEPSNIIFN
ncbi:hypothetical protein IQ07DRAFT_606398 [Pyrenochaeta sp. DS3sAY3a]|nr:hypothetical protein IQ07DRAFT_606398 [Pyrenochaeta sp. DS3sAY3a]